MEESLQNLSEKLLRGALAGGGYRPDNTVPSQEAVQRILQNLLYVMFPTYFQPAPPICGEGDAVRTRNDILCETFLAVKRQIGAAYALEGICDVADTEIIACDIFAELPGIQEKLFKDAQALYEGDPAATGTQEVLLSYPGFFAVAVYRVAHEFYRRKIPYLSRMMTEYAHGKTGIDIHAGAQIGEYFFIDHGTGIVIGETTVIGNRVKLYQGVTLGAKSFELDENGNPVKGIKRHPDIGNSVIIYANATILGGKTVIGDGCVIGANVWITHSVPAGTVVSYNEK